MNTENIFEDDLNCVFSGIYKVKESKELFNKYQNAINFLENKSGDNLNNDELKLFFKVDKFKTKIKSNLLTKTKRYFIIELNFECPSDGEFYNDIEIQILKQNYKFTYIGKDYYCFIQRDMQKFFRLTKIFILFLFIIMTKKKNCI